MCGIAGFFKKDPSYNFPVETLAAMLRQLSVRGHDATGFAFPLQNKIAVAKVNCEADHLLEQPKMSAYLAGAGHAPWAMFHCRAATNGSPQDSRNNHPIYTNKAVLVHNGIIHTTEVINTEGQCDSEIIGRITDLEDLPAALRKVRGTIAIILHLFSDPSALYLYREDNPIEFAETEQAFVFGSLENVCKTLGATEKTRSLETYTIHRLTSSGIEVSQRISFQAPPTAASRHFPCVATSPPPVPLIAPAGTSAGLPRPVSHVYNPIIIPGNIIHIESLKINKKEEGKVGRRFTCDIITKDGEELKGELDELGQGQATYFLPFRSGKTYRLNLQTNTLLEVNLIPPRS